MTNIFKFLCKLLRRCPLVSTVYSYADYICCMYKPFALYVLNDANANQMYDSSGNARHGDYLSGDPPLFRNAIGINNKPCVHFSRDVSWYQCGRYTETVDVTMPAGTMIVWCKPDPVWQSSANLGDDGFLMCITDNIGRASGGGAPSIRKYVEWWSLFDTWLNCGDIWDSTSPPSVFDTAWDTLPNTWYMHSLTWNAASTEAYRNNTFLGAGTGMTPNGTTGPALLFYVGMDMMSMEGVGHVWMSHAMFFNYKMTAAQIADIYANGNIP